MATKKENAATLSQALGTTINPDQHLAEQLEGWVGRLETDKEGVQKEIAAAQAGQSSTETPTKPASSTATQTEQSPSAKSTRPASSTTPAQADVITVKVNATVAAYGGTFADPDQPDPAKRVIGDKPLAVENTATIAKGLRQGTLVKSS